MELSRMRRLAALTTAVIFVFAGCGGAGTTVPLGAMTQSRAHQASASRMLLKAKGEDLLYVVTNNETDIVTYPGLKKVGHLGRPVAFYGTATSNPNNGDVLFDSGVPVEFSHLGAFIGAFEPPTGYYSSDAAFDPTTNNIAVTVAEDGERSKGGAVYVYTSLSGTPTKYVLSVLAPSFLGYDGQGNLFVDGADISDGEWTLMELPKGGSTFTTITLNQAFKSMSGIQWDGQYITLTDRTTIYRLQISGSTGAVVGGTSLKGAFSDLGNFHNFWIQGSTVIGPASVPGQQNSKYLGFWDYPQGGKPIRLLKTLTTHRRSSIVDATVSVAPSGAHIRK
jgi:hypothetical protein